jgi:hypothetical protein
MAVKVVYNIDDHVLALLVSRSIHFEVAVFLVNVFHSFKLSSHHRVSGLMQIFRVRLLSEVCVLLLICNGSKLFFQFCCQP